jgi:uncharacterized protein (TIGR01777 family)
MKALITGATGFVGSQLVRRWDGPVSVLTRSPDKAKQRLSGLDVSAFAWDPESQAAPREAFDDVDIVFHLAGESVAEGRWNAAKKKRLQDSRVLGTRNLVSTLRSLPERPRALVAASAVGYYGDQGDRELTESDEPSDDFLSDLCVRWEQEACEAESLGIRVVRLRIGLVLGLEGGALAKMLPLFRWGVASPLGSGRQWMPWIHQYDLISLLVFASEQDELRGAVNATAPNPVTNRDFTRQLAHVLHRPAFLPAVPRFALRASLGEFADVLLASQRVFPKAAEQAGFVFQYPELQAALTDLLASLR